MAKEDKKDKKNGKKDNTFFKEFRAELKRVTWPTAKQMVNNTIAVISIVIVFAVIIFVLDVIFENLNKYGVEGIKVLVSNVSEEETTDAEKTTDGETGEAESTDTADTASSATDATNTETTETPAPTADASATTTAPEAGAATTETPAASNQ